MTQVQIYHNPRCSKSRQTLSLLEEQGISPEVILYLEKPPTQKALKELLSMLGISAAELIRTGEDEYKEQGLKGASEAALIKAMSETPKLIQRPIVVANGKARLGRPPEQVLEIL